MLGCLEVSSQSLGNPNTPKIPGDTVSDYNTVDIDTR
jgi:hypothetical protein